MVSLDKIFATILVKNRPQRFEVDSGSKFMLVSRQSFDRLSWSNRIEPADVVFMSYLGKSFVAQ